MALMELERSWRESTSVPSRSKMSSLICSAGMGRLVLIIHPHSTCGFTCPRDPAQAAAKDLFPDIGRGTRGPAGCRGDGAEIRVRLVLSLLSRPRAVPGR